MYCASAAVPNYYEVTAFQNLVLMSFYNLFSLITAILMAFILWKIGSKVKVDLRTTSLRDTYRAESGMVRYSDY